MHRGTLLIVLALNILNSQAQVNWGESEAVNPIDSEPNCQTPLDKPGHCVGLKSCQTIVDLLKRPIPNNIYDYLRNSVCSFTGFLPDVCCPANKPDFTEIKPVEGNWGEWGAWSPCSDPCMTSAQSRTRNCDNPAPAFGGKTCTGLTNEVRNCETTGCKVKLPGPEVCGNKAITGTRIVGGTNAPLNSWPWIAVIGYEIDGQINYLCGGTLITRRHVLTAGHCVRDDLKVARLGELIIGDDNDGAKPQEIKVKKVIRHEQYSGSSFNNDITILELEKDVTFSEGIRPICLTENPKITAKFEDTGVYIAGWGAVQFRGPTSKSLKEALIRPAPLPECKEKFSAFKNVEIDDNKFCARDLNNKIDTCQGDSGGPLTAVVDEQEEGIPARHYLVGVVSFGYKCASPGFPGVYTRVSKYINWIKDNLN